MSTVERGIVITLILIAVIAIGLSYHNKVSQKETELIPATSAEENNNKPENLIKEKTTVNINTADKDKLTALTGIGPVLAQRIIDYRRENGSFTSCDELMQVKGIGPKKYERIKKYISIKLK